MAGGGEGGQGVHRAEQSVEGSELGRDRPGAGEPPPPPEASPGGRRALLAEGSARLPAPGRAGVVGHYRLGSVRPNPPTPAAQRACRQQAMLLAETYQVILGDRTMELRAGVSPAAVSTIGTGPLSLSTLSFQGRMTGESTFLGSFHENSECTGLFLTGRGILHCAAPKDSVHGVDAEVEVPGQCIVTLECTAGPCHADVDDDVRRQRIDYDGGEVGAPRPAPFLDGLLWAWKRILVGLAVLSSLALSFMCTVSLATLAARTSGRREPAPGRGPLLGVRETQHHKKFHRRTASSSDVALAAAGKPPLAESRSMHAFPAAQRPPSPPRDNAAHPHLPRHASMHNFPTAHGGGRPPSPPRDAFAGHHPPRHAQLKRVPTSPELSP